MKNFLFRTILFSALVFSLAAWSWGSKYTTIKPENELIKIPVSEIFDGNAHYY